EEKGITYLPVMEQNQIVGIFSQHGVFRWLLSGEQIDDDLTFSQMEHLLVLEQHKGIRFVSPDLSLEQGRELFRHIPAKHERVKLLLVTQNGDSRRPLLGVVSPYDILKEE
ncbi:MAG: CBS domain-containing protein, partial [Clostridia bacterium]|nr:CBS domain-containing protein [Clostridia bacterium]